MDGPIPLQPTITPQPPGGAGTVGPADRISLTTRSMPHDCPGPVQRCVGAPNVCLQGSLYPEAPFLRGEGVPGMAWVRLKENEPIDSAIRRFKKQCEKAGILKELRKREHYEKPSVRRKKKAIAARKRAIRRTAGKTVA